MNRKQKIKIGIIRIIPNSVPFEIIYRKKKKKKKNIGIETQNAKVGKRE